MAHPVRRDDVVPEKKSLSDIFNHFAKDSVQRFPELKGKILFLDMNEYKVYGCEDISAEKTGLTLKSARAFVKDYSTTRKMRKDKDYPSHAIYEDKRDLSLLLYNERINPKEIKNVSAKTEKDVCYILDHELAHLAIQNGASEKRNDLHESVIGEAVADAYAQIRYYQRFGTDSEHGHYIVDPFSRAAGLVFNEDTEHFTSFMLDEIVRRKHLIDFAALTPQQTAELAWRFAMEYTPSVIVLNKVAEALKPVREAFEKSPGTNGWLRTLAQITLDDKTDYYTFRVCKTLLKGYLEDGKANWDGKPVDAQGKYWDDIRTKLKEKEFRFAQEEILFNMPRTNKLQPPANQNNPKL